MILNVLLLHYNNYFNRTIKKLETIANYKAADPQYVECSNINFVPGDGINTSLVLGKGTNPGTLFSGSKDNFDYCVIFDSDVAEGAVPIIISRWFVLEHDRTREGQFELTLRRDVIADNLDQVLEATTYVEKGMLPANSPLIFNSEGMTFNQIKQKEEQLKDATGVPWLVAYIGKDATLGPTTINYNPADQNYIDVSAATIDQWEYAQYTNSNPFKGTPYNISYDIYYDVGEFLIYNWAGITTITGNGGASTVKNQDSSRQTWYALRTSWWSTGETMNTALLNGFNSYGLSAFNNALSTLVGAHNDAEVNALRYYNGKVIKTQDGKYYAITVQQATSPASAYHAALQDSSSALYTLMSNVCATSNAFSEGYTTPDLYSFTYNYTATQYIVTYVERKNYNVTSKISATRTKTTDAIYDIICLPYGKINVVDNSGTPTVNFDTDAAVSMAAITSLATALGGGSSTTKIYDIQLLPYCPVQSLIDVDNMLIDNTKEGVTHDLVIDNSTNNPIGIIFYVPNSAFTFNIAKTMEWDTYNRITSFKNLQTIGGVPIVNKNTTYVIPSLTAPSGMEEEETGAITLNSSQTGPGKVTNGFRIYTINKRTGKISSKVKASAISFTHEIGGNNTLVIKAGVRATTILTLTKTQYEAADYYLAIEWVSGYMRQSSANSIYVLKLFKIPVFDTSVTEATAIKVDNECNMYRLVSPNYQGEFEFSITKNGGVSSFNVDCTYKPFNPYIHVNPDFKLMYGEDFNDSRGLICQGDFTVGMLSDAFTQYELQNKNYQAIFNRQVQNMDVSHKYQWAEAEVGAAAGVMTGAGAGAYGGGKLGSMAGDAGWGMALGGMAGAAASSLGAFADLTILKGRQNEQKSYAIDMYNFSLQNIRALPYTMTRCTALTYNNKLFPFIETYSCTDEEKEAFILKLKYDGMTVNKIGKIQDYTDMGGRMIKGEIIRFDEAPISSASGSTIFDSNRLFNDSHMANEIYTEIKKGVYI